MKKLLLIGLPLLLIVGYSKPLSEETLIDKDGLKYHPETKELYSGKVFKNYMGGGKEFEGSYMEGEKDGLWTIFWENGQKKSEETYKDGKKDGPLTRWYSSGQIEKEETYKDGKRFGLRTDYYESGVKYKEINYREGSIVEWYDHYTEWYENGQKRIFRTYQPPRNSNIKQEGDGSEYFHWWYENGQKRTETINKDGRIISTKSWNEDGSVKE